MGDKLDALTAGDVLVSGGDISFQYGQVYFGKIIAAGDVSGIGAAVVNAMAAGATIQGNTTIPVDFVSAYTYLNDLSTTLAVLPVNTTHENQFGGLYLHGDCTTNTQVFNLDGDEVLNAHTFVVDCIENVFMPTVKPQKEIAKYFNLHHIGSVSYTTHMMRVKKRENNEFAKEIDNIIESIIRKAI